MSLDAQKFDALDKLILLDAHRYPITQLALSAELDIGVEAVHKRMKRLGELVMVERFSNVGGREHTTYRVSIDGINAYRREMDRMAGAPPRMNLTVWNAARIATGAYEATHGTEAAA